MCELFAVVAVVVVIAVVVAEAATTRGLGPASPMT